MVKIKNRTFVLLLVVFFVLTSMVITGCNGEKDDTAPEVYRLVIGGSASGGTSYIHAGGMAALIDKYVDNVYASVEATTGAVENARLVEDDDAQISFSLADVLTFAAQGQAPFEQPVENLRIMMMGQPAVVHFVARKDSPVNSLADLAGYKLGSGAPGSSMALNLTPAILKEFGLSYDNLSVDFLTPSEVADALSNRSIEVGGVFAGPPASAISELAMTQDIKLISIDDKSLENILRDNPYFSRYTIEAGTYPGIDEDIQTVAVRIVIVTNTSVPEDVVYNILKAVHGNQDEWIAVHPGTATFTPDVVANEYKGILPLHPGTEKYLKEIGLLD